MPTRSTLLRLLTVLSASGLLVSLPAPAQLPPAGSMPLTPAPDAGGEVVPEFDDLLLLPSERVPVRYPPEKLDRAARVQARLEALDRLWEPFLRLPLGWNAVLLDQERWLRSGFVDWGAPLRIGPGLFAVPVAGDAASVAFARGLIGGALPDPLGDPLLGTREEAASMLVADQLLVVEAARALVEQAGLFGDQPWVTGVLMQLVVRYAWERAEPEQTLSYVALFDALAAAQGGARAHRLADYRPDLPYPTELWYQAQFVRGADEIWIETGWTGTHRRLYRWGKKGEAVTAAELEKKYPRLIEWKLAAFAP